MQQLFSALVLGLAEFAGVLPAQLDLKQVEERMRERPAEAIKIAREAAESLPPNSEDSKRLYRRAAEILGNRIEMMSRIQIAELADLHANTLSDGASARRVQERWLKYQERSLTAGDARNRVELARLWHDWLRERHTAARLCQEALAIRPDLQVAERMLREVLRYEKVGKRWVVRSNDPVPGKPVEVRRGMTAVEVRDAFGPPLRVSRQVLYRRFLEQWSYELPAPLTIEFDCLKGQGPRVLTVHSDEPKP
jgi:hypothetical protein